MRASCCSKPTWSGPILVRLCRHHAAPACPSSGVAGRKVSEGSPRVPGRSEDDDFPAAAGSPAAQPAAGGAAVRVTAYPAGGATHGFRAAAAATARPRRGPPSARPRGSAPRLLGSPRHPVQGHLHPGTPPRPPGPTRVIPRSSEGSGHQIISTDCTLTGLGHVPPPLPPVIYTDLSKHESSPARCTASNPDAAVNIQKPKVKWTCAW